MYSQFAGPANNKGLTTKSQGPNQPKHRLRQANTMPTHVNLLWPARPSTFAG